MCKPTDIQTAPEEIEITPEVVAKLAKESEELRTALRKRIQRMWEISPDERQAKCV